MQLSACRSALVRRRIADHRQLDCSFEYALNIKSRVLFPLRISPIAMPFIANPSNSFVAHSLVAYRCSSYVIKRALLIGACPACPPFGLFPSEALRDSSGDGDFKSLPLVGFDHQDDPENKRH